MYLHTQWGYWDSHATFRHRRAMSMTSFGVTSPSAGAPTVSLEISGMSCGHCVAAVRSALDTVSGVRAARIVVGSAQIAVASVSDLDATTAVAIDAIRDAGYDARVVSDAAHVDAAHASSGPARRPVGLPVMDSCCCGPRHS